MSRSNPGWVPLLAFVGFASVVCPAVAADDEALGFERTPPRLSYLDGEISFFRPGASDWVPASLNTPLESGDELYASADSDLEVQIGPRAFMRAGEDTELGLTGLEPDYLQLRVTSGTVSLDLRAVEANQTFEINTPNAAFTIERSGYYRVEVHDDATTFITRRGGAAFVTLAQGASSALAASEQVVITGIDEPQIETYAAPELDGWDRWNYARTDRQLDAVSARYVPAGVYGAHDLDQYGSWRVVPTYGAIWVPSRVRAGWAPYTTGRWIYDGFYGWTWVDAAPWGWAPYHYGRWVYVSGYWGWAPGPIVARPYYAPALVAFYGGGFSVGLSVGGPIGWVALGWGEPLFPWWGSRNFRSRGHWAGWGGPRVVNNVVIRHNTVVHINDVHRHEHAQRRHAFTAMDRKHFGRGSVKSGRIESVRAEDFRPVAGDLKLRPARESLTPSNEVGRRPPREWRDRSVVATRAPRAPVVPELAPSPRKEGAKRGEAAGRSAEPAVAERRVRVVDSPRSSKRKDSLGRPPFGESGGEERAAPPPPPRYERSPARKTSKQRTAREEVSGRPATRPPPPDAKPARASRPGAAAPRAAEDKSDRPERNPTPPREKRAASGDGAPERPRAEPADERKLPGVPANRVYRGRADKKTRPKAETSEVDRGGPRGDGDAPRGGGKRGSQGRGR